MTATRTTKRSTGTKRSTVTKRSTGKGTGSTTAAAPIIAEPVAEPVVESVAVSDGVAAAVATMAAGMASIATEAPKLPEPKCASARVQAGKPHPNLLQVIVRKGAHPGKGERIRRWHRYHVGMSVLECRMTEGLDHLDVIGWYVKRLGTDGRPLMTLRPMTDEERVAALARWEGKPVGAQPAVEVPTDDSGTDEGEGTSVTA